MNLYNFLRSASSGATYLAAGALTALVTKILILNRWPAHSNFLYESGALTESILASIVASYFFYLFVVHLKEISDKNVVSPYIDRHTSRIISDCQSLLNDIGKASNSTLSLDNASLESIKDAFSKIHPYSKAPLLLGPKIGNYANWFQYFNFRKIRTQDNIKKIMAQIIYVDVNLVILLAEIEDCSHFAMLDFLVSTPMNITDLTSCSSTFYEYCEMCRALKKHTKGDLAS